MRPLAANWKLPPPPGEDPVLDMAPSDPFHDRDMTAAPESRTRGSDYESTPITRTEYISAIVHLYRGELYRATSWRIRLDNTTNWAVLTTAGLLSLSFGGASHSHAVLLVGFALITVFWGFEARRYRFADIWYARVRKIEENFYGPILRRDPLSPEEHWGSLVAEDLFHPQFKITRRAALGQRFRRNYWAIYLVLLLAWGAKVLIHPEPANSWEQLKLNIEIGPLPWWLPLVLLGCFAFVVGLLQIAPKGGDPDEVDHWKFSP